MEFHYDDSLNAQLSLNLRDGLSRGLEPLRLLIRHAHIDHPDNSAAAQLSWQAEEDVLALDPVETPREDRHWVDPPLVPNNAPGKAGHWVADGPGSVALEADHLVRAPHHCLVDALQRLFLEPDGVLLEEAEDRDPPDTYARP